MSFKQELFIPFHLGDPAGKLFFAHVFTLAHDVYEQFICNSLGIAWPHWFQNEEWIVPIKQSKASYRSPIIVGTPCLIDLQVSEIRNSSFSLNYQFSQNNLECCKVKTVHVFCNSRTKIKQDIPVFIQQKLLEAKNNRRNLKGNQAVSA